MPRNPNKIDDSGGFPEGFEVFASIKDPRNGGNTRHHFGGILFIAFTAVLCGVRSYELMEEFAELRESWLRKWLKLPNSIPCAIEGKAMRGSRSGQITHLHAVSAWACEAGMTLAQAFVGEKTNESTAKRCLEQAKRGA